MATIVLAAVGAAAGAGFGGTVLGLSGAVIGRAVGATLGRVIDQRLMGAGSEAVETGRVDRFRHELYALWTDAGPELAVLAELLLRGPQTKGDLRTRAARMAPIDSLDALDEVLTPLLERRLVVYLTGPDRRGAVVTHGFHPADELARLKAHHAHAPATSAEFAPPPARPAAPAPISVALEAKLAAAVAEIDALKARVAALEAHAAGGPKPPTPDAAG